MSAKLNYSKKFVPQPHVRMKILPGTFREGYRSETECTTIPIMLWHSNCVYEIDRIPVQQDSEDLTDYGIRLFAAVRHWSGNPEADHCSFTNIHNWWEFCDRMRRGVEVIELGASSLPRDFYLDEGR